MIRENLDLGRPDQVQLIFHRRVIRRRQVAFDTCRHQPGYSFLHVDYKHSRIKNYFKEGSALRTETTVNNTRDFGIGKRLKNLAALRQVGFQANRRLRTSNGSAKIAPSGNVLKIAKRWDVGPA